MKVVYIIISIALVSVVVGCGIPTSQHETILEANMALTEEYHKLVATNKTLEEENANLHLECENLAASVLRLEEEVENKNPRLFTSRTEIEAWLSLIPKPSRPSADVEEWFIYALYYQTKAMHDGYLISISYTFTDRDTMIVTCDIITEDGYIYYFNPDDAILDDTGIRIPVEDYDINAVPTKYATNTF